MLPPGKLKAAGILNKELKDLQDDPIATLGVTVGTINKDVFHWQITMMGPQDTPYAGGLFILTADFPSDYPNSAPTIKFKNKMYHLNVSKEGAVCISTLSNWVKGTTMSEVLSLIFALFYRQNPNSAFDSQMAQLFKQDKPKFDENARIFTQKYANINDNNL